MSGNYAIALTHAILAGTSFWVIYRVNGLNYATGSFAVVCLNSVVGIWKYGNPEHGNSANDVFNVTNLCASLFAIPGVCADLYLHYGYDFWIAMMHLACPLIPAFKYALDDNLDENLVDLSNFVNEISMGAVSFNHSNYFGIYGALCHFANSFVFKKKEIGNVPKEVMFNLGMSFYTYFAYRALTDSFVRIH